jgi:hypothetical protein
VSPHLRPQNRSKEQIHQFEKTRQTNSPKAIAEPEPEPDEGSHGNHPRAATRGCKARERCLRTGLPLWAGRGTHATVGGIGLPQVNCCRSVGIRGKIPENRRVPFPILPAATRSGMELYRPIVPKASTQIPTTAGPESIRAGFFIPHQIGVPIWPTIPIAGLAGFLKILPLPGHDQVLQTLLFLRSLRTMA